MPSLETLLQRHAMRAHMAIQSIDVAELLKKYTLLPQGEGVFHQVWRIKSEPWVLKEAKWRLGVPFRSGFMHIHSTWLHIALRSFGLGCLPTKREIKRQYKRYLTFASYMGMLGSAREHPDGKALRKAQLAIRKRLPEAAKELEKKLNTTFPKELHRLLSTKKAQHNFLPKEYMLIGQSLSNTKQTAFVVQEYKKGTALHDANVKKMSKDTKKELMLFLFLLLLLQKETGLLPDTRPRYPFSQTDWLMKTDNVLLTKEGVQMIDTRWFWLTNKNIISRGFFLPEWIKRSCVQNIERIAEQL